MRPRFTFRTEPPEGVLHADDACTHLPGAEQGFDVWLITGQHLRVGLYQERDVGIDEIVGPVLAEKLPHSPCSDSI